MNVGSLFSGIGGFDLGLERAGMRVLWQCESDPYCRRVLARHWPGVPCYEDVRALGGDVEPVDLLCGGFPCQDLSYAGMGAGIDGARSGLWSEYARLVGELRPRYVVVENVSALLARGMGRVLGDLAALGYDAEWDCIPASALGAPHQRDRLWLVAYPQRDDGGSRRQGGSTPSGSRQSQPERPLQDVADAARNLCAGVSPSRPERERARTCGQPSGAVGDPDGAGLEGRGGHLSAEQSVRRNVGHAEAPPRGGQWLVEPDVGRVAHGVPARVDRLRALGNALVPQIAEWIGRRIMSYEAAEPQREPLLSDRAKP